MSEGASYKQILRSSFVIGGASVLNIIVGLVRTKVAAILLGPAGVGLIGLFQNMMNTASTVAGMGWSNVGTRQIAEASAQDDELAATHARRALALGTLVLATIGAAVVWLARGILARRFLGDAGLASSVGLLAGGVFMLVASGSQTALLNGLRRIDDIARVSVVSSILSTVVGVAVVARWHEAGVVPFVLSAPACSFLVGHAYVARLPRVRSEATPFRLLAGQWRTLARLGTTFMFAGLIASLAQLSVRTLVRSRLGDDSLGNFQASWQISMTYLGLVLTALGADYYPRLTVAIHDHEATNRMVNEQTEVALLLGAPVLLAMMALAPWVVETLYSGRFTGAAAILRWQLLGDVLKVASWPLGFVLLAAGDGRAFFTTESIAYGAFTTITWVALPGLGSHATGVAFFGMYSLYLPLVYWLASRRTGFRWSPRIWRDGATLLGACIVVKTAASRSEVVGASIGVLAAAAFGAFAVMRLSQMGAIGGPIGRLVERLRARRGAPL